MAAEVVTPLKVRNVEPVSESPFYDQGRPRGRILALPYRRSDVQNHGESSTSFKAEVTTT
jgi:hypothetical protein